MRAGFGSGGPGPRLSANPAWTVVSALALCGALFSCPVWAQTLTVTQTGTGSGTVTSTPAGINCGADCSEDYAYDTAVVLTASPTGASTFGGWSGSCSGTGSCLVTMVEARTVSATFSSPTDDDDGDGISNADEIARGTDPTAAQLYFAEGSLTSLGNGRFETRFSLFNPSPASGIDITLKLQGPLGGPGIVDTFTLAPGARRTIDASLSYPTLNAYGGFSTVIEGRLTDPTAFPKYNVVADRQMTWARGGTVDGYASHAETATRWPATQWYLAEGSTLGSFELYYLLQNPGTQATTVSIKYVFPSGPPCTVTKTVDAGSRATVYVNDDLPRFCGVGKRDVSAEITAPTPITVERAMYLDDGPGGRPFFYSGHESAGVLEPQASWLFAEGATGTFFDTYILVFNQEPIPLDIRLTFLRQGLPDVSVQRQIPANSRSTFALDVLREFGTGNGQAGAYVVPAEGGVSTVVDVLTPGGKVIAERAMWWPGPLSGATGPSNPQPLWEEAHVSAGATRTSTLWAIADAEAQGPNVIETYALISNVSAVDTVARITVAFTDSGGTVTTHMYDQTVGAKRRFTMGFPSARFGTAFDDPTVLKRFSVTIESLGLGGNPPGELVVERAHYARDIPPATPGSIVPPWPYWPAGSNNLATPLRAPTYPAVDGDYAGTVTITLPELGETMTCPGSTVVTQSGSLVNMAPVVMGGECNGFSIPLGEMVITTMGAFTTYLSGTMSEPDCGIYDWTGSGGFFGRELRLAITMVSATCLNIDFSMALVR